MFRTTRFGATARLALVVVVLALLLGGSAGRFAATPAHAVTRAGLAKLPLSFIANQGQLDKRVAFAVQGKDASALFTRHGVTYVLGGRYAVKVDFVGARAVRPSPQNKLPGIVSVFKGDRSKWKTAIPTFRGIVYRNLWPGIDLVWSGNQGRLKYTLLVRPGADPATIRLRYRGARLSLAGDGLVVRTPVKTLHEGRPAGSAPLAYTLRGDIVGFRAPGHDRSRTLVIDPPALLYAGFLGGSGTDRGNGIAVDAAGNAYITGRTTSSAASFPDTPGALDQTDNAGNNDAFVAKVNAAGSALVYAGFLGGTGDEQGFGIAVDRDGNAYITGDTDSSAASFPDTAGALDQTDNAGDLDAFVAKVNAAGSALVYAGFLGGSGGDQGFGIAVDSAGNAYITGATDSTAASFPDTPSALDQTDNAGNFDAFVAKVNASGSALVYAGFLGGSDTDFGDGIAVDSAGNAYVTGLVKSTAASFPDTTGALDQSDNAGGGGDAFVAKVNAAGSALVYAGFLGGSSADEGFGIALDSAGNAYVAGRTASTAASFPDTPGALDQTDNAGSFDAFVAKVNAAGSALVYAGFLGGSDGDGGTGIAVDSAGAAYVTGGTNSTAASFPDTPGALDQTDNAGGGGDAFVAKVNPAGSTLVYAGFLGGSGLDAGLGIAVDSAANAYVTGYTESTAASFPDTPGALDQSDNAGNGDAFVAKVAAFPTGPTATITKIDPTKGCVGTAVTITGTNLGSATAVTFNATNAKKFTVTSSKKIVATVAAGTTTGQVTVLTKSNGSATSAQSFEVRC